MIPTLYLTLALATNILTAAGTTIVNTIQDSTTLWKPGSMIITGHQFIVPDSNTTTAPARYSRDETTPFETFPLDPGTEYCYGHTGALLCNLMVKLTGSGGHRNSNAGSFVCGTATCSIVETRAFVESGSDLLYGGWTTSPGANSGTQLYNRKRVKNGISLIGSGAYVIKGYDGAAVTTISKDVPPGATVKFQWEDGNSTEDYSRTKAAVMVRYWKFYNP